MARVVALVPDLLFGSRVLALLRAAGHDVELCARAEDARARAGAADVLLVDLTQGDLEGATLVPAPPGVATLAVYAHVDAAARDRARDAGFDLVVPRSRMVREGAALVGRLAGEAG